PLALLYVDRNDLLYEAALRDGACSTPMALGRSLILPLAADGITLGHVLGGHSHQYLVERVGERPVQSVDQRRVANLGAPPDSGGKIGRAAHHFRAARQGYLRIADRERIGSGEDRLQAGPA